MLIDTHVHTDLSDGLDDVETVIHDAFLCGIDLMSITDHDCVNAYPGAFSIAEHYDIHLVPGVELTTKDEHGCNCIHIVGLGIETGSKVSSILDKVVKAREDSNKGFLENMNAFLSRKYHGWMPAMETKPSIFYNVMSSATAQGIRLTEKELMDIILDRDLWVPLDFELTLDEAVSYIREWGGVPVLAHPFDFSNDVNLVLKRFLAAGGEAVELCKYRYKVRTSMLADLPAAELMAKEREMNLWTIGQAREHGLKLTMASDHHDGSRAMGMRPEEYGIDITWLYDL